MFMDLIELADYRKKARKVGITDHEFQDLISRFYTYYMNKSNAFQRIFPYFATLGKVPDGAIKLDILVIMKSSPNKDILLHRIPYIYKCLTALYATPYQVATMIQEYLHKINLSHVAIQVQYDDTNARRSKPTLRTLASYSENPEKTAIGIFKKNILITLL